MTCSGIYNRRYLTAPCGKFHNTGSTRRDTGMHRQQEDLLVDRYGKHSLKIDQITDVLTQLLLTNEVRLRFGAFPCFLLPPFSILEVYLVERYKRRFVAHTIKSYISSLNPACLEIPVSLSVSI